MNAHLISILVLGAITLSSACAAVVATAITPYRSLADSPWHEAIAGGDALAYYSHTWDDCDPTGVGTLPDGFGVYEDFESCVTPWMVKSQTELSSGRGVDADDSGGIDGIAQGNVLKRLSNTPSFTLNFITTTDGKLPQWFGFVWATGSNAPVPSIEIFGIGGGLIAAIQLTDLTNAVRSGGSGTLGVRFQGFLVGQDITGVRFTDAAAIDHFQYGYGTAPIPEPTILALTGLMFMSFKRRR